MHNTMYIYVCQKTWKTYSDILTDEYETDNDRSALMMYDTIIHYVLTDYTFLASANNASGLAF